jgi:hypothetical protein
MINSEKRFWYDERAGLIRDVDLADIQAAAKKSVVMPERTLREQPEPEYAHHQW